MKSREGMKKREGMRLILSIMLTAFGLANIAINLIGSSDKDRVILLAFSGVAAVILCFLYFEQKATAFLFSLGIAFLYALIFGLFWMFPVGPPVPIVPTAAPTTVPTSAVDEFVPTPAPTATPKVIDRDAYRLPAEGAQPDVTVDSEANLRWAPSSLSASALYENGTALVIAPGDTVKPIWRDGAWAYVKYRSKAGDRYGYIPGTLLAQAVLDSLEPLPDANLSAVVTMNTNLRSQPDASALPLINVTKAATVTLLGYAANDWAYVKLAANGKIYYGYLDPGTL